MKAWLLTAFFTAALTTAAADVTRGDFGAKNSDAAATPESSAPKSARRTSYPFHGTLASIDSGEKSLRLKGQKKERVILITAETRFFKNGAKAKALDGTAGERVTGTLRKNAAGLEEAVSRLAGLT